MATQLETLHQLQVLDTRLLEKRRVVERYEADLAARRAAIDACASRLDALAATRKDAVVQRALAERRIEDLQEALRQKRQRAQKARNEKEARAGQDEIASAQEEISEAETAFLEAMARVDEVEASMEGVRRERTELEEADHRQVGEDEARIAGLRVELEGERSLRDAAAAAVDAAMLKKYDFLLDKRQGLAVAVVDASGCCAGCHVQIPPQTLLEVRRSGALRVCPMCQRILFAPPPEAPAEG